jgi:hypothetical protein
MRQQDEWAPDAMAQARRRLHSVTENDPWVRWHRSDHERRVKRDARRIATRWFLVLVTAAVLLWWVSASIERHDKALCLKDPTCHVYTRSDKP